MVMQISHLSAMEGWPPDSEGSAETDFRGFLSGTLFPIGIV